MSPPFSASFIISATIDVHQVLALMPEICNIFFCISFMTEIFPAVTHVEIVQVILTDPVDVNLIPFKPILVMNLFNFARQKGFSLEGLFFL